MGLTGSWPSSIHLRKGYFIPDGFELMEVVWNISFCFWVQSWFCKIRVSTSSQVNSISSYFHGCNRWDLMVFSVSVLSHNSVVSMEDWLWDRSWYFCSVEPHQCRGKTKHGVGDVNNTHQTMIDCSHNMVESILAHILILSQLIKPVYSWVRVISVNRSLSILQKQCYFFVNVIEKYHNTSRFCKVDKNVSLVLITWLLIHGYWFLSWWTSNTSASCGGATGGV